jgi:hypothetical protein
MAVAAIGLVAASAALAALPAGPSPTGPPRIVFNGLDVNPVTGKIFRAVLGQRPSGDSCAIQEEHGPRAFTVSPFGPGDGRLPIFLTDRRRPSLTVLRWNADPNVTPGLEPTRLPVQGLHPTKRNGKPDYWQARVKVPPDEPSYLVVRASWRDSHDCAAGPDRMAVGVALIPPVAVP